MANIRHTRLKLSIAVALVIAITCDALQPEECSADQRKFTINQDADAFIGVVLPIRSTGTGLLGCGQPSQDGVELLEALKWAAETLNHKEGEDGESFIPGVKLGLQVWDTCGHSASLPYALSELLPLLRDGPALCSHSLAQNNESALFVGIVDGAGATRDPNIRMVLSENNVPALVLQPDTLIAAEDRAKAMISMAVELQWRQVAFIFGDDDYGTRMYRTAVRLAADSDLCVVAAERFTAQDQRSASSALMAIQAAAATASATVRGSNSTGVLVMSRRNQFVSFLDTVRHMDNPALQWLFSDLLTDQDISSGLTSDKFFSLTIAPPTIPRFEQYWVSQIQNASANNENFVQLFEMLKRGCRMSGWSGARVAHLPLCQTESLLDSADSLGAALRGRNAAAALHVIYTLAHGLKSAWKDKCQEAGVCPEMRLVDRQQFNSKYLAPLEIDYSAPQGRMVGLPKVRIGDPSEMAASSLTLMSYRSGKDTTSSRKLRKLYEYHLDGVESSADRGHRSAFNRVDFCSEGDDLSQCPRCLRQREARARDRTSSRSLSPSSRPPAHHTIPSAQHVYIAGVFSVHEAPFSGAPLLGECGALETRSARQVEAFTWALKRVNEKYLAPVNIKLGAVLLDACHSSGRALALPATLLGEGSEPILAAVNALPQNEADLATSVFKTMNITTIMTESLKTDGNNFSMQVNPSPIVFASALKETLKTLGWDYISVVRSEGDESAEKGVKMLRESSICVASEEILTSATNIIETVAKLISMRKNGARGVVLWTTLADTTRLMEELALNEEAGKSNDLHWMVVNQKNNEEVTSMVQEIMPNAFIYSPVQAEVQEFNKYLENLKDDDLAKNTDNPWLEAFYSRVLKPCDNDTTCDHQQRTLQAKSTLEDARIIQAVYAVGASIARARRELCPDLPAGLPGLCPPGGNRPDMKQAVNAYLHNTPSERAGGGEDFKFTSHGAGDVPVEIYNMRQGGVQAREKITALEKVGTVSTKANYMSSLKAMSDSFGAASKCTSSCSTCKKSDRFVLTHQTSQNKPTFYLGVTLGMHPSSNSNPLECSSQISRRGIQNMEAFLWALDRFNANSSVHLSGVVMDSCGSRMRTARDVAILLEHKEQADKMITVISADGAAVAESATNLAAPFNIPVISSEAPFHKQHSPFPLQLNAGLKMRIQTVMRLITKLGWNSISVITTEDGTESEAMMKVTQFEAKKQSVSVVNSVYLPDIRDELAGEIFMNTVLETRNVARESGVRAVLLLLPPKQLEQLFTASRALHQDGEVVPGELVYLGIKNDDIFQKYSDQTMGSLVLQPKVGGVPEFENYFRSLKYENNRNPWFQQFWSSLFECNGENCKNAQDLSKFNMNEDPEVVTIMNAVMTVSHALDSVKREVCPDEGPAGCIAMQDAKKIRTRLYEITPHMAFVGAGMSGVAFSTAAGDNLGATLHVLNVRRIGSNVFGLVPVGTTTRSGDLQLNRNTMKAYGKDLTELPYSEISSKCADCEVRDKQTDFMEVSPGNKVALLSFSSVHSPGTSLGSKCGPLQSLDAFQKVAAVAFAIEKVNSNVNFSGLSGLHFDDCSSQSRAIYQSYRYFANEVNDNSSFIVAEPKTITLALFADNSQNEGLQTMLTTQGIPYTMTQDTEAILRARLHAAIGVGQELGWSRISIFRKEGSKWGKAASEMLTAEILPTMRTMCLGEDLELNLNHKDLKREFQLDLNTPYIMLFETPEETQKILDVISESKRKNKIVIASGWDDSIIYNSSAEIFAVGQDLSTETVPGFREFITATATSNPGYVPASWAAEYLNAASSGAKWKQAYGVSEIIKIVELVAEEVQRLCFQEDDTPLCGQDPKGFREEIQATINAQMSSLAPNLAIWRMNSTKEYEQVGGWKKKEGLNANVKKWRKINATNECESFRIGRSGKLTSLIDEVPNPPAIIGELRAMWGLVTGSISILGALLTVAFVVYFASATEKAVGTSVLGYQILFGVLILYLSNFAFLVAPNEISCLIRRLVPSMAYAMIVSGMLIKVLTTWRYQDSPKANLEFDPLARPSGLICSSFSLVIVQGFLSGGWILLVPASIDPPTKFGGSWTCSAASSKELLSSLSYVATLIFLTIIVSFKARKNSEARNILVCCIFLALEAATWTAAAYSESLAVLHKDCVTGVIAGLIAATLVLFTIFIPKLAQHSKLSKDKKIQHIQHATMRAHKKMQPVMYGLPQYTNSTNSSSRSVVIKAFPDNDELVGVEHILHSSSSGSSSSENSIRDDSTEPELANLRADHEELETHSPTLELPTSEALYPIDMYTGPPATTSTFGHGAPPPPPMPRISLVDHCVPGSNEFSALPPPPASLLDSDDDDDYSRHEGISYI